MFKPFPCNQLATKAQSFPRKSSNTASPIARHAKDFTWNRGCSSNSPPPGRLIIKFPPPRDGKGVKCPGYARGGGGHVEASIWPIHNFLARKFHHLLFHHEISFPTSVRHRSSIVSMILVSVWFWCILYAQDGSVFPICIKCLDFLVQEIFSRTEVVFIVVLHTFMVQKAFF